MPLELLLLVGGMLLLVGFIGLLSVSAIGFLVYRRVAETRYGEPPRWMQMDWRRSAARAVRRRESTERLADLVAENEDFATAGDDE